MATAKQEMEHLLAAQPDDATTEELVRELAFELMVKRGITDSDAGRTISSDEMLHRINLWQR